MNIPIKASIKIIKKSFLLECINNDRYQNGIIEFKVPGMTRGDQVAFYLLNAGEDRAKALAEVGLLPEDIADGKLLKVKASIEYISSPDRKAPMFSINAISMIKDEDEFDRTHPLSQKPLSLELLENTIIPTLRNDGDFDKKSFIFLGQDSDRHYDSLMDDESDLNNDFESWPTEYYFDSAHDKELFMDGISEMDGYLGFYPVEGEEIKEVLLKLGITKPPSSQSKKIKL